MQIFRELSENKCMSLALGYFDGVHLGHKEVITSAVNSAKKSGTKSAVITFVDHPCCYIWGVCPKYIMTREMREEKIKELGVDYIYELDFEKISKLTADEYLKDVLVKYFAPCSISVGWNHNFGANKSGDVEFLKENSKYYGYELSVLQPSLYADTIISSTKIREYLTKGDIQLANSMLGYEFSIKGEVVRGKQIGRTLGFKTANINYPAELIEIPYGAYETDTIYNGKTYKSVSNFGIRPTVKGSNAVLEVHILDFDKEIYGEHITVNFKRMLRPEMKFSNLDELKTQIQKDINSLSEDA